MDKPRPKALTAFAEQGMVISETFKVAVQAAALPGFRTELMEPEASTGQGVRSLQHIRLVPVQGGLAVSIGSVHVLSKRGEVRSYAFVAKAFHERFGRPPPFLPAAYEQLVQAMASVLKNFAIELVRVDPEVVPRASVRAPETHGDAPASSRSASSIKLLIVVLAVSGLLGVLAFAAWRLFGT